MPPRIALACLAILACAVSTQAAPPKLVPLAEAAQHVGEEVAVELVVMSSRQLESGKFCFLNSHRSFNDKANFTVAIRGDALDKFANQGIADPDEFFLNKKIRVSGKISLHKEKPQIVVDSPSQIVTVIEIE